MSAQARIEWKGGVNMQSGSLKFGSRFGVSPTPACVLSFADGSGSGQINDAYEAPFSILTTATLEIDLKGGNGEVNVLNQTLAFTKVKGVEIILTTPPAAGVSIRFGPQGITNAAQLWYFAATANYYAIIRDRFAMFDSVTGWTIDSTHKVLGINNPGAATVAGWIRVIGVR